MQSELVFTLLDHDAWPTAPSESDPCYFRAWQHVSVALQRALRQWIPEFYFRDLDRLENREAGYTMVIYSASRLFYGRPRTEFTYDIADATTLPTALRSIGCPTEKALATLEARLERTGRKELERQYSTVWYRDILAAVKKRPKHLLLLLAREARLIDSLINLGTQRDAVAAHRFAKASNSALRNLLGVDMRALVPKILNEATIVLSGLSRARHSPSRFRDSLDGGALEDRDMSAAGSPYT